MIGNLGAPVRAVAQAYAKENELQIDWSDPTATTSKLAVITQTSREFDFEGAPWPAHFYHAGPLHDDDGRERVPFPWERLTGELLIYASLGTLVNGQPEILRTILGAVAKLAEFQVVLSIGKNISQAELGAVPPNTLVVSNAPQIELLKRAVPCITHAGLNTTLESLVQGVPLVAIPIRIRPAWRRCQNCSPRCRRIHGSREAHRRRSLGASTRSPRESGLPNRGRHFRRVIARTRGLDLAADVIERVFLTRGAVARV